MCRSDKFEDPFEGLLRLKDFGNSDEMIEINKKTKQFYFINSWHMNPHQSDAMWKIFTGTKNGIAIKSDISKLIAALQKTKEEIYIGEIFYRDFDTTTYHDIVNEPQNKIKPYYSTTNQFNYKRISFEHEKELRLFFIDMPIPHAVKNAEPRDPLNFKKIDVILENLIDEIVIAPFADQWFVDMVKSVTKKLGYDFKISSSDLYNF
jgi:hypothetical protein